MDRNYYKRIKNVDLHPLREEHIEYLRKWRNDGSNTKYLRQIGYITSSMQRKWYDEYLRNTDEIVFAIVENETLHRIVGSLALYHFQKGVVEFGKILVGDPEAHGKSVGYHALQAVLDIAFVDMKMEFAS